jgi:hypothetical protein
MNDRLSRHNLISISHKNDNECKNQPHIVNQIETHTYIITIGQIIAGARIRDGNQHGDNEVDDQHTQYHPSRDRFFTSLKVYIIPGEIETNIDKNEYQHD